MKAAQIQISPPEISANPVGETSNLIALFSNDKGRRYFGRALALKVEILAALHTGLRSQTEIAAEYQVSKQAVGRLAKKARAIYETGERLTVSKG
jgi:hypothetical protein